jgi:hypothetical protein
MHVALTSRSVDTLTGLMAFGLAGKAKLSRRWFITGKADLGGGGSNFT